MKRRIIALLMTVVFLSTCFLGENAFAEETDTTQAFVARLYETLLSRAADPEGLNDWTNQLKSGTKTGVDIIQGFVLSNEFTSANYSDEQYVDLLYKGLFDRAADAEGRQGWLNNLSDGLSRTYVLAGFIGSQEYQNLCARYGILPGQLQSTEPSDKNADITRFVSYLYRYLLNRNADASGLNTWVTALSSHKSTASSVVYGFVFSDEFKQRSLSSEDYIRTLYRTVLSREADSAGLNSWLAVLNSGMSETYVLRGFIESAEFSNLCNQYGITRGSLTTVENRDKNQALTEYVRAAYMAAYGGYPSTEDLNYWTGTLLSNTMIATDFLNTLLLSAPVNQLSTDQFITKSYQAILSRTPSSAEVSSVRAIAESSRRALLDTLTGSIEFATKVSNIGIALRREGWNDTAAGRYYVKNGATLSGWQTIDGQRYYFDPANNNIRATGWAYVSGYKLYFDENGHWIQNVDGIIGKQDQYYLTVNTSTNTVTVYAKDGANGFIIPVKAIICSTGAASTPTIKGTFTLYNRYRWMSLMGGVWGQWCTQISGGYLFHSTWYWTQNNRNLGVAEFNKLGTNASHGCVRLPAIEAKWIYDNCIGSQVTITTSCAQPLDKPGRPTAVQSGGQAWDPTDPTI